MEHYDLLIVGGGISGLTAAYRASQQGLRFLLLEGAPRCGGAIHSARVPGALLEGGPDSLLAQKPAALDLARELGLENALVRSNGALPTLIVKNGRAWPVPEGFRQIAPGRLLPTLLSPLLSWPGKFRLLLEPFIPPSTENDQTLAAFVRRRLGHEVLDSLVQPLVAGIFAADPEQLSLGATFPFFLQMERESGSLTRALWRKPPSAPGMVSFPGGLGQLVDKLVERIPAASRRVGVLVQEVTLTDGGWCVSAGSERWSSDQVLLAVNANDASRLLQGSDAALSQWIASIHCRDTAVLNQIWPAHRVQCPPAGGLLVPSREGLCFSAASFAQAKWPGRVDPRFVAVRIHLGGAGREQFLDAGDQDLARQATAELRPYIQAEGKPLHSWLVRHHARMPEYRLGHRELVAAIESRAARLPGLQLAGNWLYGVGIADCVARVNKLSAQWQRKEVPCLK